MLHTCCTGCSSLFAIQAPFHNIQYDAGRRFQVPVACLQPKWCAKILRLVGFVSPLKTNLKGYLKFCRTVRTIGCRIQRVRINGSVCNRGKLIAPGDLHASSSRSGPDNALKLCSIGA